MAEGAIFGTIGQIAATAMNNQMIAERTQEDRRENYLYGEKAAQNADARTRALYNDYYSPAALLKQYQEAGLSPSMMFDGTPGQGGMSGAQGGGSGNLQTPFMPYSIVEAAQAKALLAQARKTDAEANIVENTGLDEAQSRIQNNLASAGLSNASTNLVKAQEIGQKITNDTSYEKTTTEIHYMQELTNKAVWDALGAKLQYTFDLDTYDTRVKTLEETYANLAADTLLKNGQYKLTVEQCKLIKQQVTESINRIAQTWKSLQLQEKDINNRREIALKQLNYEYDRLSQEWMQFTKSLSQSKELAEKGITQGYWGMGAEVFNNIVRTAGNAIGMYYLMGGKGTATQGGINTGPATPTNVPGGAAGGNTYFY